jgi:diaminopimelate decarboxylase
MSDSRFAETPVLVVDSGKFAGIASAYQKLGKIYYPVKSNSAPEVLDLVKKAGCDFLVSCPYYLDKLRAAGVEGGKILYDNCIAGAEEIAGAVREGVCFFTVDSEEQLGLIHSLCPAPRLLIKASSDTASGEKGRFGVSDFAPLKEAAEKKGSFAGVSFYIPDSVFSFEVLQKELKFIFNAVRRVNILNLGGSLKGVLSDEKIQSLLDEYKSRGFYEELLLEPGRSLLNPCTEMRASVKKTRILNGEKMLYIDASIYSGLMDVYIENKKFVMSAGNAPNDTRYYVYGNTPDSADFFGTYTLPSGLKEGDIISIAGCGAYSVDITSVYSGAKPLLVRIKQ